MRELDKVNIICHYSKIYVPQSIRRRVLYWYHFYKNRWQQTCKKIRQVFYWKCLVTQGELFTKMCKICQQFKKRNTLYGNLSPKNIAELKPWDTVHVDLIVPYRLTIWTYQVYMHQILQFQFCYVLRQKISIKNISLFELLTYLVRLIMQLWLCDKAFPITYLSGFFASLPPPGWLRQKW